MNIEMAERLVDTADLVDLARVFEILAKRVYEHRKSHNGFVPREIFAACIGIGGIYPCVEIIVEVTKEGQHIGYALKKRDNGQEQGWENQYQIPGVAGRITDSQGAIFSRLAKEILGEEANIENVTQLVGCEIHDESERLATCWTLVYRLTIGEDTARQLSGTWKIFAKTDDPEIIDHHRRTLAWADDPNRPLLADLRPL